VTTKLTPMLRSVTERSLLPHSACGIGWRPTSNQIKSNIFETWNCSMERSTPSLSKAAWRVFLVSSVQHIIKSPNLMNVEYALHLIVGEGHCKYTPLTVTVKPGFHYPSWRPELTATSRVDGPCWRPVDVNWASGNARRRARQHGPCWRVMETGHPSTLALTRAVNSGSGNRA